MPRRKFAVIGVGQFGSAIAKKLSEKNSEVLAIDIDEEKVESIKDEVSYAVTLDSTDIKALASQNVSEMDAVVVSIGANFQCLLLTTFVLQELNVKRIIVRAQGPTQRKILEKMGVTEILSPEDEVASNIAENLMNPNVLMCMELPDDYEILEVKCPPALHNRTLQDIALREKYKVNLITVLQTKENGEMHIVGVPQSETILHSQDLIVVFGKTANINRFMDINQ